MNLEIGEKEKVIKRDEKLAITYMSKEEKANFVLACELEGETMAGTNRRLINAYSKMILAKHGKKIEEESFIVKLSDALKSGELDETLNKIKSRIEK